MPTVTVFKADEYLKFHPSTSKWNDLEEPQKEYFLRLAEQYILDLFNLRQGYELTSNYKHAIVEQAIHMLAFDKERQQLQREGVTSYKVDDMSFQMRNSFISPLVKAFLKDYIYRPVGEIV